jgi:flagella basal body P-ring formation protein FlgA
MLLIMLAIVMLGGPSVVPRTAIERTVEEFVRSRVANPAEEMSIEFRSVPDSLVAQGSGYSLRIAESGTVALAGNASYTVEVVRNGTRENQCIVSIKVRTFDTVLVSTRQLGQHERITSQDVRRERIETTALRAVALTSVAELVGLRTKRILNAGSVLTGELTQAVPDIIRGASVTLIVKGKNFRFSVNAVAREDGMKGEQLTVQRTGSGARFQATVLDTRTVEMTIQ